MLDANSRRIAHVRYARSMNINTGATFTASWQVWLKIYKSHDATEQRSLTVDVDYTRYQSIV